MGSVSFEDRRSSHRLLRTVPVLLAREKTVYHATTENVGAQGALLRSPVTCPTGTLLDVTNLENRHTERFRVVWMRQEPESDGGFKLGLNMLEPSVGFWGFDWSPEGWPLPPRRPLRRQARATAALDPSSLKEAVAKADSGTSRK